VTDDLAEEPAEFDEFELVLLVRGEHPPELDEDESELLHHRHLGHLRAMREAGHLKVAGPLDEQRDDRCRGLCFYQVGSIEEATRLASIDPAVVAGRFSVEVMKWYTPKGEMVFPST
jgi:uncharacterized protein YciI